MDNIAKLQSIIDNSKNIVFFSGAGVSTDSGLKDFRSEDGLYNQKNNYSPEELLSSKMFYKHPDLFYEFYKKNLNCLKAQPNITHKYLKKLEDKGKLKAIITQNIDGLHIKAGNKNVYEIHGTIYQNHCISCHEAYNAEYVFSSSKIPKCLKCGAIIKPDVILYGEMLPDCFLKAQDAINKADTLIVAGSSLVVEPASSLVRMFSGKNLIIINNSETNYDNRATLVIHENLKKVFSQLK